MSNYIKTVKLSELICSLEAGVSVNSEDRSAKSKEFGVLKTSAVSNGKFISNENKVIIEKDLKRAKLNPKKGEIVISRMNTPELVGEVAYVDNDYHNLYLPDRLWQTQLISGVSGKWLTYVLTSPSFKHQIKNIATGTSNSMKNISKPSFLGLEVPDVPVEEQQKIASIISTWDKAIELKEKLIERKKEQKKGLMQKLLTGEVRVPGFKEKWHKTLLGDVLKERKETGREDLELLAITAQKGVVKRSEVNIKDTSSEDKSKYKRICPGDIGYNTMRMWQGVSGISRYEGIISPAYTVLTPTSQADSLFLSYLFKLESIINQFRRNSQGLVDDTLNLKYVHFKTIKVTIPTQIDEQKKIAEILYTIDKEIQVIKFEKNYLLQQKQGLMQKLLTGEKQYK